MTGGLFAVLDDIALLLDDAAVMSKVAAKKTAGILGDDLAVNAEKATGFHASRELPVLWAITKGAFLNKLIILPLAFFFSAFLPWLLVPVLLVGGAYLCYEGCEKIHHVITHHKAEKPEVEEEKGEAELLKREKEKVRSAIRTDFILSLEIIALALSTVIGHPLIVQIIVVSLIALLATVGVYGIVALIVRMDDAGFYLIRRSNKVWEVFSPLMKWCGVMLVSSLPWVIRGLAIVGTLAMLLVGGGMYVHNIEALHHMMAHVPSLAANLIVGVGVGAPLVGSSLLYQNVKAT